jgi:predicted nucleic acid-binding protein
MRKIIIADTSFLIAIQKLGLFNQVRDLYKEIYITQKIAEEFKLALPDWIIIQEPDNLQVQTVLSFILDAGEASAISLAYNHKYKEVILIIDDLKARKEAIKLGFKITGTLGVLYKLKQEGLIKSLKSNIFQLNEIGFRISPKIVEEILRNAGENI